MRLGLTDFRKQKGAEGRSPSAPGGGVRNQKRDELLFVAPVIRWGEPLCHEERRVVPGPTRRVSAGIVSACGL